MRWEHDCRWVESAWRAAAADSPCAVALHWSGGPAFEHRGSADFARGMARLTLRSTEDGDAERTVFLGGDRQYTLGDDGRWHGQKRAALLPLQSEGRALVDDCFGLLRMARAAGEELSGDGRWALDPDRLALAGEPSSFAGFVGAPAYDGAAWFAEVEADPLGRLARVRVWSEGSGPFACAMEARLSRFGEVEVELPARVLVRRGGLFARLLGGIRSL